MIQDILPRVLYNAWRRDMAPEEDSVIFVFRGAEVLARETEDAVLFPRFREMPEGLTYRFLFAIDEEMYFLAEEPTGQAPGTAGRGDGSLDRGQDGGQVQGFDFQPILTLRRAWKGERYQIFAAMTAHQLADWYTGNRYCGACGHPTVTAKDERAIDCPACKRRVYPKIVPAVIVGVTNGDKILLTKYAGRPFRSYALIAGFTEIGETLEETVAREVMEEAGLKIKNIRYYKSQPWAIADDILMGFYCDVDGDDAIHMDRQELKEAAWFAREDVILQPDDFSLTNEMMMMFQEGREPRT